MSTQLRRHLLLCLFTSDARLSRLSRHHWAAAAKLGSDHMNRTKCQADMMDAENAVPSHLSVPSVYLATVTHLYFVDLRMRNGSGRLPCGRRCWRTRLGYNFTRGTIDRMATVCRGISDNARNIVYMLQPPGFRQGVVTKRHAFQFYRIQR